MNFGGIHQRIGRAATTTTFILLACFSYLVEANQSARQVIDDLHNQVIYLDHSILAAKKHLKNAEARLYNAKQRQGLLSVRLERQATNTSPANLEKATLQLHLAERSVKTREQRLERLEIKQAELKIELKSRLRTAANIHDNPKLPQKSGKVSVTQDYEDLVSEARAIIKEKQQLRAQIELLRTAWERSDFSDSALGKRLKVTKAQLNALENSYSPLEDRVNAKLLRSSAQVTQR